MRTIESRITSANRKNCEDGMLITDKIVVVTDGCTPTDKIMHAGKTSGVVAKDMVINYCQEIDAENITPEEFFRGLDEYFRENTPDIMRSPITLPRAMVIVYNSVKGEVWNYGDCQAIVDGTYCDHSKEVDKRNGRKRREAIMERIENGCFDLPMLNRYGERVIRGDIVKQYSDENVPGGYPVINGNGIREEMIKVYPAKEEVVLATDGYIFLRDTLAESERTLSEYLRLDPLCIFTDQCKGAPYWPEASFDDRTYWRGI